MYSETWCHTKFLRYESFESETLAPRRIAFISNIFTYGCILLHDRVQLLSDPNSVNRFLSPLLINCLTLLLLPFRFLLPPPLFLRLIQFLRTLGRRKKEWYLPSHPIAQQNLRHSIYIRLPAFQQSPLHPGQLIQNFVRTERFPGTRRLYVRAR